MKSNSNQAVELTDYYIGEEITAAQVLGFPGAKKAWNSSKYSRIICLLFYIGVVLLLVSYSIDSISGDVSSRLILLQRAIDLSAALLFICKVYLQQYSSKREITIIMGLCLLGAVTVACSSRLTFASIVLMISASRGISIRKLAKVCLVALVLLTLTVIALHFFGILKEGSTVYREAGAARYALGFRHPNNLARNIFFIFLAYSLERSGNVSGSTLVLFTLVGVGSYILTQSRTGFALILLLLMLVLAWRCVSIRKPVLIILATLAAVTIIAAILLMVFYDGANYTTVIANDILSSRPYIAHWYYSSLGISLFGTNVVITEAMPLDPAIILFIVVYGIVPTMILIGLILWSVYRLSRDNQDFVAAVLCVLLIACFTEAFPLNTYDFMLSCVGVVLFGSHYKKVMC